MGVISRLGLFCTGYLPFFLIVLVRNWHNLVAMGLFFISGLCAAYWIFRLSSADKNKDLFMIEHIDSDKPPISTYFIWYAMAFVSLSGDTVILILQMITLLILGFAYSVSDLSYHNPILYLLGYSVHTATVSNFSSRSASTTEVVLITNSKKLTVNDFVNLKFIEDDVVIEDL
jgi:hypothetical protein